MASTVKTVLMAKDGAVIDKGADGLVIVAIIIGCIAIAGEIAFLVYAIIKKEKAKSE